MATNVWGAGCSRRLLSSSSSSRRQTQRLRPPTRLPIYLPQRPPRRSAAHQARKLRASPAACRHPRPHRSQQPAQLPQPRAPRATQLRCHVAPALLPRQTLATASIRPQRAPSARLKPRQLRQLRLRRPKPRPTDGRRGTSRRGTEPACAGRGRSSSCAAAPCKGALPLLLLQQNHLTGSWLSSSFDVVVLAKIASVFRRCAQGIF